MASILYKDAGFLLNISPNTVVGHSTKERGRVYVPEEGGVPYPEGMKNLIKVRMELADKNSQSPTPRIREQAEQGLEDLETLYNIISRGTSYETFAKYIALLKEEAEKGRRKIDLGLLRKVLETEEKQEVPEIVEEVNEVSTEETKAESPIYNPKVEYDEEDKIKPKKVEYPNLNNRELNMPLDRLVDITLRKIDALKKSIKANPTPEKQRQLEKLEAKYRSIYEPWKDGVFENW